MDKLNQKEFQKCTINERCVLLKKHGEHIAVRQKGLHLVHLYSIFGFFVEVWIILSLNEIQWVEIQNNSDIIKTYSETVNLKKGLGIS